MHSRATILFLLIPLWGMTCYTQEVKETGHRHPAFGERSGEREEMVKNGIENYPYQPVRDPLVLEAMRHVPRHRFVPEAYRRDAYLNTPLLIGYNQTISQPYIVAHMTELLELSPDHRVLEIGTGSGYQAAVLAELSNHIYTVEIIPQLGQQAKTLFNELGYDRIHLRIGDGYEGWPEEAPFDRIIVTCAPDDIPPPLLEQLAPGGRMVIPVGAADRVQYMVVVNKDNRGRISQKAQYPVRFVPMTGRALE